MIITTVKNETIQAVKIELQRYNGSAWYDITTADGKVKSVYFEYISKVED